VAISFDVYRPVVRLVIGLLILAVINWILTALPMVKAVTIPGSPVSITAIISVIVGCIMIALLLNFGKEFSPKMQSALPTITEIGAMVSSAIALAVITIAYLMFKDAVMPLMKEFGWIYPLTFLVIAIWPLVTLITSLYKSSNKIADLAVVKIAEASGELIKCAKCSAYISSASKFCPLCSAPVTRTSAADAVIKCDNCGEVNSSEHIYCLACGKKLVAATADKRAVVTTKKDGKKVDEGSSKSETVTWQ